MVTCTLRIGDRVALSSADGAPEVEYALFDPGEIELAATGPGMVQEVGYQTTAEDATARLAEAGMTWAFVLETASAMQPTLAMAYARGPAVRRIATALGPAELFDGFRYDPAAKRYEGRWIDLPSIGQDLGFARFTQAAQLMHLVALLREVGPSDPVRLVTRELMAAARKGGRSYKRGVIPPAADLPAKLLDLTAQLRESPHLPDVDRSGGPSAAEMLDLLRDRVVLSPDTETQDRLRAIEKAIGMRQRPLRGPLTDPELWALDEQLSAGRIEGVVELIEALEKSKGKQPATAYLRVRAALLAGRETPRAIAERIASLALSMPSFVELELLACEAWNAAGEPKRALPFARDLIANATVNDELRVRESQQFVGLRPSQASMDSVRPPRSRTLAMPEGEEQPPQPRVTISLERPQEPVKSERTTLVPEARDSNPGPPPRDTNPGPASTGEGVKRTTQPLLTGESPPPRSLRPRVSPPPPRPSQLPPPASSRRDTPPMTFAVDEPARPLPVVPMPMPRAAGAGGRRPISGTWIGPPPAADASASKPTPSQFGGVPSADEERRPPSQPGVTGASARTTSRPSADVPRLANRSVHELMRGASQPPFRSDSPEAHAHVPRAPAVPRFDDAAEAASALTLPEGMSGVPDPIETLPRTVLDARVQFTFLARELGREYDEQLGVILRADISGVEAMQRVLLERYKTRSVTSPEAAADVRRHGAFLSEILARTFDAFWVDIGPNDVGYWAMLVPPGTRVWPFGRILRLIAMQHNERDLVSYFLELQARAARH